MEILKVLNTIARLSVQHSHENVEQVIHEHWRSAIKCWDHTIEKMQDISNDEHAFDNIFAMTLNKSPLLTL